MIWYLTKDWTEDNGGAFLDLEAESGSKEAKLVPIYNSLALFEVPHWHAVEAVQAKRYRYSIFGWWHQQGKRYDLDDADDVLDGQEGGATKKKKGKLKRKAAAAAAAE